MGVKNSDLVDLIETTLPDLPKQYFEVTWTRYDCFDYMMAEELFDETQN